MKNIYLFVILSLSSFLTACIEEDYCKDVDLTTKQCETDNECIKEYGEYYKCSRAEIKDESDYAEHPVFSKCEQKYCVVDECKKANLSCGLGECRSSYYYEYAYCKCNEGAIFKNNTCTENSCLTEDDCSSAGYKKGDDYIYLDVCSSEGMCVENCDSNWDCKGETSMCIKGVEWKEGTYEDVCTADNPNCKIISTCIDYMNGECYDGKHKTPYVKLQHRFYSEAFWGYLFCENNCDEENLCNPGFVCNNNKECVPICISDEDCLNDKFSKGKKCSSDLFYCIE